MPSWCHGMRAGPGLKIEVLGDVPADVLHAVGFRHLVAGAQRPVPPAGARPGLEHADVKAGAAEFQASTIPAIPAPSTTTLCPSPGGRAGGPA